MSEFPIAKLCDVAEIVMGTSPPGDLCNTAGIGTPLLNGPTEFGSRYPTPVQFTAEGSRFAEEGDLLFCVRGSTTGRMNWADQDYAIGRGLAALRHKHGSGYQPFVFAAVSVALADLLAAATGSTFPSVSKSQLHDLPIPLPPLPEQRAIAGILGALDDKIDLNRRMNGTLEAMARALFKSWFVDFDPVRAKMEGRQPFGMDQATADLFPDRLVESEIGLIPEGWEVTTLGDAIDIFDNLRVPLNKRERGERQGEYPYYGAASIMDYVDDYLFDGVHVLAGEDGSVVDENGRPVVQYVWGKFWVNNHAHVLKGKNSVSDEHLLLYLMSLDIAPYVTGAVQPKLNQTNLKSVPFLMPTETACNHFSRVITKWFESIRITTEQSRTLAELRDLLLPKLLSGEIRVADAEQEVEAAL